MNRPSRAVRPTNVICSLLAISSVAAQSDGARATLEFVRDRYLLMDSLSMVIRHHNSSGLFPGDYTQELRYLKPGRFELKVKSKAKFTPTEGIPGGLAPDYFCDGKVVASVRDKAVISTSPVEPDPNTMPGWEVAGGPILGWLMGSPASKSYIEPPAGLKTTLRFGTRAKWQGEEVREILLTLGDSKTGLVVSLFIDRLGRRLVGFEWNPGGKTGWAHYTKQEANPKLPGDLGKTPEGS